MTNQVSFSFVPQDNTIIFNGTPYISGILKLKPGHTDIRAIHWTPEFKYIEHTDGTGTPLSSEDDFNVWISPYIRLLDSIQSYEKEQQLARYQDYNYCVQQIKSLRDFLLKETDFAMMPDYPITEDSKQSVEIYRQALRDITKHPEYPWKGTPTKEIPWPMKPTIVKKPSLGDS